MQTLGRVLAAVFVVGFVVAMYVMGQHESPDYEPVSRPANVSSQSCDDYEIQYEASVAAKDNFEEGSQQRFFHNSQIIEAVNYLEANCGW